MATSANPSGNNNHNNNQEGSISNGNGANGIAVPEKSVVGPTQAALMHDPGLSKQWTADEQSVLEDLLAKYSSDSGAVRYAKIAVKLQNKTARDVALRCRWMANKRDPRLVAKETKNV